jgi:hypothetical protein
MVADPRTFASSRVTIGNPHMVADPRTFASSRVTIGNY